MLSFAARRRFCFAVGFFLSLVVPAFAQRQMEPLGRGLVALHSATSQAYLGWRLLATDPDNVGFNIYRSANGGAWTKLNSSALTNTTDYLDTTATFTVSNAWRVVPVTNGVEGTPGVPYGLAANSPVRQYLPVPLVTPGAYPPYDVKFCWVGDFDGDGEYDLLVDRISTTAYKSQFLQAYKRDGTFLWQMDMGPLSTNRDNAYEPAAAAISVGDKDNVTVYDLDGDGRAEVIVRTANGTVFADSSQVVTNNSTSQFLSILDGQTGVEKARALIPNPYFADGPLNCHAGIVYLDGIHPSIIFSGENRVGSGAFQRLTVAWDYRNGQLTQRWLYQTPSGQNDSEGHQLRIADVNHDGKDEIIRIGSVISDSNGVPVTLYSTELAHGDRYHVTDIDPDRPGLEMYAIQQLNTTLLATSLQDLGSGQLYKKWYSGSVVDVGRGVTLDMDPNTRGCEMYSTQPGIFDAKGNQIWPNNIWPPEALWWDADLSRELEDGAGSGGYNPVINKYNPSTHAADRLFTIYNDDGDFSTRQQYGARAPFWGDILGDWREELILLTSDYSTLRIYTTKIQATNRLYCLMQNPTYRSQCTYKGYYQASYVDYYLGNDMPVPPVPPVSAAQFVWRGNASSTWDTSAANWFTNNLWISNNTAVACPANSSVLFDLTGSNSAAIALSGSLTPSDVRVWSPKDYTFAGSGALTGTTALTKGGAGKLIFNGTNTYTGKTLVSEGPFLVNGSLPNSPVTVRGGVWLDGRLGGTGSVGGPVRFEEGAGASPGSGANSPGTFTISNSVTFAGRTISDFDLSDNPAGTTNDQFIVIGNLILQGTNTLYIRKLNSTLQAGGVYPLIKYSGTLTGGLSNLVVAGLPGIPLALTNPPGQIALVIKTYRAPANITWTGGSGGNAWDLLTSSNWLNGAAKDQFAPGDTVRFDNTGSSNLTVNFIGDLVVSNLVVDSTSNYVFSGSGNLIGPGGLTKTNAGTLTINAVNNTFTGKVTLAGGTLVVSELDAAGYASPLGNGGTSPASFVMSGSSTLRVTGESYTDRGMTLGAGTNSLEVFNAADQVTIAGLVTGSGAFQKLGAGTLALTGSNSYSGVTIIKSGAVSLGGDTANQYAFGAGGTGTVVLDGGTLTMFNDDSTYNHTYWNLNVPAGSTGRLYADDRCYLHGTLTGGGTFDFNVNYVRTELDGNWSAFTGLINVDTGGSGDFRINNSSGYANAAIYLASGIYAYHMSGSAVSIGELAGESGATLSGTAWTVGAKNTDSIYFGRITGNSLTKTGTGTLALAGTNSYTGATAVNSGTLLVNGDASAATGTVTVSTAGTLGGTGVIGGATTINGRLAPGNNAIGTLTFLGDLTCNNGSTNFVELNKAAGTNDVTEVGGTLTYGGRLIVTNLAGALTGGSTFKIFDATTYAGSFASSNLPALGTGLAWDTSDLTNNGTIAIVTVITGPKALVWKGDGTANDWDVNLTGNWLDVNNAAAVFTNGDYVTFNDTGSNGVPIMLAATMNPGSLTVNAAKDYIFSGNGGIVGGTSLIKSGSGTLTLAVSNAFTGGTVISNGTVLLATTDLGLTHRWSFNNTLADSVGTNNAVIVDVGANNATLTTTNVTMTGGAKASSDYVDLGDNLLPKDGSPVTIELWATPLSIQNWSRIFDFGASTTENLMMSWTRGTTLAQDRIEWVDTAGTRTADDTCQPYTLGTEFHIVMVIEPGAGSGGTTRVTWYRASGTNSVLGTARGTFNSTNTLAMLNDTNCWLGYSEWPDNAANASYNEVRIWNRALTTNELQTLHAAGPNATLETLALGRSPATLAATGALNLPGSTAKFDNQSGQSQAVASLAGLAGSEVKLTSGGLVAGADNSSTAFAGFLSGTNSFTKVGSGTLTLTGTNTATGPLISSNGTLLVNGSLANAIVSINGGTLSGSGIISGNTSLRSSARLVPGNNGIGTLTFSNTLALLTGSTNYFEISHSPLTNDLVKISGTLTNGGALIVTNLAGTLAAGDSFKLFNATTYQGAFSSVQLPALAGSLAWNTNSLNTAGLISIVSVTPPIIGSIGNSGSNLVFAGSGGTPSASYYLTGTTNLTVPVTNWTRLLTNQFDASGNFVFTNTMNPNWPQGFYRLLVP